MLICDSHKVVEEQFDTFVQKHEIINGMPPKSVSQLLALCWIDLLRHRSCLIKRVYQSLMHFSRARLVYRKANLHQKSL